MNRALPVFAVALVAALLLGVARNPSVAGGVLKLDLVDGGTVPDASVNYGGLVYHTGEGLIVSNGVSWSAPGVTQTNADQRYLMIQPTATYSATRQRTTLSTRVIGTANTTFAQYGTTSAQSVAGTATLDQTLTYPAITYATTSSAATTAGVFNSEAAGTVKWAGRPIWSANVRYVQNVTGVEMWYGLVEGTLFSNPTPAAGPTAAAGFNIAAIGFNDANQNTFMCCAADGTNQSCTTTGVVAAINTDYNLVVDYSDGARITCTVNGTSVNHSSNLPTSTSSSPLSRVMIQNQDGANIKIHALYDWTVSVK